MIRHPLASIQTSPRASIPGRSATPPPQRAGAVASGNGTAWWREGWRLFTASPGIWIAITVLYVIIMVMLSFVPVLGSLATTLLAPVFAGGVLSGCRAQDRGGELRIEHLFGGFSDRLGPLMIVGLLYLIGTLAIVVVVGILLFAAVGMTGIGTLLTGDPLQAGVAALAALGIGALFAVLLGLLLGIPLMMAFWFAPALVALRNDEPLAATKASFDACLRNMYADAGLQPAGTRVRDRRVDSALPGLAGACAGVRRQRLRELQGNFRHGGVKP